MHISSRIQAAEGYTHLSSDAWLRWDWDTFFNFFTTGPGSIGKKKSGPTEAIKAIPFNLLVGGDMESVDIISAALSKLCSDFGEVLADQDEMSLVTKKCLEMLKNCNKHTDQYIYYEELQALNIPFKQLSDVTSGLIKIASDTIKCLQTVQKWPTLVNRLNLRNPQAKRHLPERDSATNSQHSKKIRTDYKKDSNGGGRVTLRPKRE